MTDNTYNGTSSKLPTESSDDHKSKLLPARTDYDLCKPDPAPLLERLDKLTTAQAEIVNRKWALESWPRPDEMDWPQLTALGKVVTSVESASLDTATASMEIKLAVAASMQDLDIRIRHMCITRYANYGIDHYASPLVTTGQCETMLWCLANIPDHWLADARDVTDTAKPFDEVAEEQRKIAAADDDMAAAEIKRADAELVEVDPPAPVDWDQPVPLGSWSVIRDWIHEPEEHPRLTRAEIEEQVAERAHRAGIAEVRRKGRKARKVVMTSVSKLIPDNYVPPYQRVPAASADEPMIPTSLDIANLGEDEALHIVITRDGVRYWSE